MSDTSTHQPSTACRACGNQSLTTLSGRSERVCTTCGFVADTDTSVPSAPFRDGGGGGDIPASWTEHYTVHNSTEQQVATAFEHLEGVGDKLHLSAEAREASADKYAAAQIAGITDGRSTAAMIAAAICVGTRSIQQPLPADRVAEASDCDASRVKQYARLYQAELDQGLSICDPAAYVAWLCTDGQFGGGVEADAEAILDEAGDGPPPGSNPASVAGAAIYLAAEDAVTQRTIADLVGVTPETICLRVGDLREVLE